MKTKLMRWTMLCSLLLVWVACTRSVADVEEATLTLSDETEIVFAKEGSEKTISVQTNAPSWAFVATGESWLTAVRAGDKVTFKATKNTTPDARKASIVFFAGNVRKILTASQTAADVSLELSPPVITVPAKGGVHTIDIVTNTGDWELSVDESETWVKLAVNRSKGLATVTVAKNEDESSRSTKVTAKSGSVYKEIDIVQKGLLEYFLPLISDKTDGYNIMRHEIEENGNIFGGMSGKDKPTYLFYSTNLVFREVHYLMSSQQALMAESIRMIARDVKYILSPEFRAFLKEKGFEEDEAVEVGDVSKQYYKPVRVGASAFKLSIEHDRKLGLGGVFVEVLPYQVDPIPTYDDLPYRYTQSVIEGYKVDQIIKWETSEGGSKSPKITTNKYDHFKKLSFDAKEAGDDRFQSTYYCRFNMGDAEEEDRCFEKTDCYRDYSKVFFEVGDRSALTREFLALCKAKGFKYKGLTRNGYYRFDHEEKSLMMYIKLQQVKNVNDGKLFLDFRFGKLFPNAPSDMSFFVPEGAKSPFETK